MAINKTFTINEMRVYGMLVRDIMRTEFHAFNIHDTLASVCESMDSHKLYGAPVIDDQGIIRGIFTRPHLIRALTELRDPDTLIQDLMQPSIVTLEPDNDISEAIKMFVDTGYRHYPVRDSEGHLVGLVLSSDLLQVGAQELYRVFGTHRFDYLGNAMIGIDAKGYIRSVSESARRVFGPRASELLNKHVMETLPLMENLAKEMALDAQKAKHLAHQLTIALNRLEYYRNELKTVRSKYTFNEIVGMSPQMKKLRHLAAQAAKTTSTVLIRGESGTGKELLAQAIHNASSRSNQPFIKVNCAAIPESLMESELFGYCEGAFTGALRGGKPGKFELANGGTIFLDEIGDLHPSIQSKLLRVLQEFEFERLGGTKTINVDVRVIAATNRDLRDLIKRGKFRSDLFYRLNVVDITTPPLRERREDIDYLTDYLLEKITDRLHIPLVGISEEARQLLRQYDFPGNVRELENILERAINVINENSDTIQPEHLQLLGNHGSSNSDPADNKIPEASTMSLEETMRLAEKNAILEALRRSGGNRNKAAQLLNIHRSVLYKKMYKHNIR
ncbi:MAG TPA: sigma 54-interacting transcriptional regulator [Syntrophomonadaceae bacterium]|nr:sigma 54-interacting transcriptional regulator [Syntrophomonadaceae bacterium]